MVEVHVPLKPSANNAVVARFMSRPDRDEIVIWDGTGDPDLIEVPQFVGMDTWLLTNEESIQVHYLECVPLNFEPAPYLPLGYRTLLNEWNRAATIKLKKAQEGLSDPVAKSRAFHIIKEHREAFVKSLCAHAARATIPAQRLAFKIMLDWYAPRWEVEAPLSAVSLLHPREEGTSRSNRWRIEVLNRDGRQCRACAAVDPDARLQAHHIKTQREFPALRFDIDNGVTLCTKCHSQQHRNMGERLWQ